MMNLTTTERMTRVATKMEIRAFLLDEAGVKPQLAEALCARGEELAAKAWTYASAADIAEIDAHGLL